MGALCLLEDRGSDWSNALMATPPPGASPLSPPSRQSSLPGDSLNPQDVANRLHQLEALLEKRHMTVKYLREVLRRCYSSSEGAFVLGCVQLGRAQVTAVEETEVPRGRSLIWLHLGLSLRKLLHKYTPPSCPSPSQQPQPPQPSLVQVPLSMASPSGGPLALLRGVAQLLEELEYHHSSASAVQSVKLLLARPCPFLHPDLSPSPSPPSSSSSAPPLMASATDLAAHLTPRLYRFNNNVVYEHLQAMSVSFPLHYPLIVDCVLDALSALYTTWQCHTSMSTSHLHLDTRHGPSLPGQALLHLHAPALDALNKVDAKLRSLVLDPLAKEVNTAALHSARHELKWLRQDHGLA